MRRLLKFLHTMGAVGLLGAMAALLVMLNTLPPPSALAGYAATRAAMSAVATWLFLPSLGLSLLAGVVALAANRAYRDAGWAWLKLLTGVLLFEGGLQNIEGPMRDEAARSAAMLASHGDPSMLAASSGTESGTLWVLTAVATANVVLGIWRPRLLRLPD